MHDHWKSVQDPRIRSPPAVFLSHLPQNFVQPVEQAGAAMTLHERLSSIQEFVWTIELLGEALVQLDEFQENDDQPLLNMRGTAGIHQAIRTLSRQAGEMCGGLLDGDRPDG